jgi:hypothetical protein
MLLVGTLECRPILCQEKFYELNSFKTARSDRLRFMVSRSTMNRPRCPETVSGHGAAGFAGLETALHRGPPVPDFVRT